MVFQCGDCKSIFSSKPVMCPKCGSIEIVHVSTDQLAAEEKEAEDFERLMQAAQQVVCFTVEHPTGLVVEKSLGLVFGNSSKQAFWGLSTQANRLSRAYEAAYASLKFDAAMIQANAVVGIRFALNNSTGSSASGITGSSEAVMLLGTAVIAK